MESAPSHRQANPQNLHSRIEIEYCNLMLHVYFPIYPLEYNSNIQAGSVGQTISTFNRNLLDFFT